MFYYLYRIPDTELQPQSTASTPSPQPSITISNLAGKQLSQSYNGGSSGKSNLAVGLSTQSSSFSSLNRTSRYDCHSIY